MQVSRTRNLHQKFDASFSCEFLVRVSRTSFSYVCLGHYNTPAGLYNSVINEHIIAALSALMAASFLYSYNALQDYSASAVSNCIEHNGRRCGEVASILFDGNFLGHSLLGSVRYSLLRGCADES